MKVDHHISELLFDHDCVIVPSFGGFLASYRHAKIHPTQHTFSPPSKKIAFNVFLKQNDGLLANHIAGVEKRSYPDALQEIQFFVNQCEKDLSEGRQITLDRVGTLYYDGEKNLQFEPFKNINYLRDAFGFSTVQYLPVKRDGHQRQAENQFRKIISVGSSTREEKTPLQVAGKSRKRILSTAIVTGALIWFSFNIYLISPNRFDLSSLNPFSSNNNTELEHELNKSVPKQDAIVQSTPVETKAEATSTPSDKTETVSINEKDETKPAVISVQDVAPALEVKKYLIIGGAFQVRENADAFVKTLQAEGFPEAQILDTTRRLKMVCMERFSSLTEASAAVEGLKAVNKSAWIYAR